MSPSLVTPMCGPWNTKKAPALTGRSSDHAHIGRRENDDANATERIAQPLGLGTIPQAALARYSGLIRRHFNLADDRRVVCGISFGFADHSHKVNSYRTSRAKVADTVTFVDE